MRNVSYGTAILLAVLGLGACSKEQPEPAIAAGQEEHHDEHDSATNASAQDDGHATVGEDIEHVALTPAQITRAELGLAHAGPGLIRERLSLYGMITPNAERVREVTARFPGAIRTVTKRVGDTVRQGETLATIESNESLQTYAVVAPLSGVVTARHANPGESAGDDALFTIADLSTVWAELSVFPRDIGRIHLGQEVRIRNSDSGASAIGKVVYVAPFRTSANQAMSARVLVQNTDSAWPPGLYVTGDVTLSSAPASLTVSSSALQTLEERPVVFVQCERGFEARPVQLGRSDQEASEVIAGVTTGETYVTSNSFILKAELGKGDAEHGH
jgi:cobalt-zinc-cadmium efflux system membrane fusion protein